MTTTTGYKFYVQTALILFVFLTAVWEKSKTTCFFLRKQRAAKLLYQCGCKGQYIMFTLKPAL